MTDEYYENEMNDTPYSQSKRLLTKEWQDTALGVAKRIFTDVGTVTDSIWVERKDVDEVDLYVMEGGSTPETAWFTGFSAHEPGKPGATAIAAMCYAQPETIADLPSIWLVVQDVDRARAELITADYTEEAGVPVFLENKRVGPVGVSRVIDVFYQGMIDAFTADGDSAEQVKKNKEDRGGRTHDDADEGATA